ncbi:hypothetical protein BO82DRAFT_2318 [Aspergillus uvarum CBS 121591]|uniref:Uncharacterized protein n=1 Tax=Aspergillus uvarum CBS 121591 TaxID=1448315 RepID=A0A319DG32_9EURO|nr:hypothetical protein BO82DRAFT_2318 [Aspergillus uvarum CBS 121591]PYH87068.1 hypothetical protein BO82DRAFT_2318 [Aspergillus uvarum CBS 121591]
METTARYPWTSREPIWTPSPTQSSINKPIEQSPPSPFIPCNHLAEPPLTIVDRGNQTLRVTLTVTAPAPTRYYILHSSKPQIVSQRSTVDPMLLGHGSLDALKSADPSALEGNSIRIAIVHNILSYRLTNRTSPHLSIKCSRKDPKSARTIRPVKISMLQMACHFLSKVHCRQESMFVFPKDSA